MTATDAAASNGQAPPKEKPWQELEEDQRHADATGIGVKVVVAGRTYQVHFGELTGLDARALRLATGYTTYGLLNQALGRDGQPDIDTAAAIVWLARRRAGEMTLTYDEVLAGITFGDSPLLDLAEAVPEAPAEIQDDASGEAVSPPV